MAVVPFGGLPSGTGVFSSFHSRRSFAAGSSQSCFQYFRYLPHRDGSLAVDEDDELVVRNVARIGGSRTALGDLLEARVRDRLRAARAGFPRSLLAVVDDLDVDAVLRRLRQLGEHPIVVELVDRRADLQPFLFRAPDEPLHPFFQPAREPGVRIRVLHAVRRLVLELPRVGLRRRRAAIEVHGVAVADLRLGLELHLDGRPLGQRPRRAVHRHDAVGVLVARLHRVVAPQEPLQRVHLRARQLRGMRIFRVVGEPFHARQPSFDVVGVIPPPEREAEQAVEHRRAVLDVDAEQRDVGPRDRADGQVAVLRRFAHDQTPWNASRSSRTVGAGLQDRIRRANM